MIIAGGVKKIFYKFCLVILGQMRRRRPSCCLTLNQIQGVQRSRQLQDQDSRNMHGGTFRLFARLGSLCHQDSVPSLKVNCRSVTDYEKHQLEVIISDETSSLM